MALLLVPGAAEAATVTVETEEDDSALSCALRDAITAAKTNLPSGDCGAGDAAPTVDRIQFSLPAGSQITLLSPLPQIDGPLRIEGPGADQLEVNGNEAQRVFDVDSGSVAITDLTVAGGRCLGPFCEGGGIRKHR